MSKKSVKNSNEFDCELKNSSMSSVFTDNEEIKKKKRGRVRKIRNTENLEVCFKAAGSLESTQGSDSVVKKRKSVRSLTEIALLSSRSTRKKRKPIFSLPDITDSIKSAVNDVREEALTKEIKQKRKIRNTQDLNTLLNDDRDCDIAASSRSKKTKKARLPSFLPSVDIIDENKKLNKTTVKESSNLNNIENSINTDTTDNEEAVKKGRKGRTRRTKKKTSEDEIIDIIDESKKLNTKSVQNSYLNNNENNTNTDTTDSEETIKKGRRGRPRKNKMKTSEALIASPVSSEVETKIENNNIKRNTFNVSDTEDSNTPNKTGNTSDFNDELIHTCPEIPQEPNSVSIKEELFKKSSKRAYFDMSSSDDIETSWLNRSRETTENLSLNRTNQSRSPSESHIIVPEPESTTAISNTSQHSNRHTFEIPSNREEISDIHEDHQLNKSQSLKKSTLDMSSNLEGAFDTVESSWLNKSRKSTRNRSSNRINKSRSNLETHVIVPEPISNTTMSTSMKSERLKRSTFEIPSNMEETLDTCQSRQFNNNQSLKRATFDMSSNIEEAPNKIEPSGLNKSTESTRSRSSNHMNISRTSLRTKPAKPKTSSNPDVSNIQQDHQVKQGRRSTRNRVSICTITPESIEPSNTLSGLNINSSFASIPNLELSNNISSSKEYKRVSCRVSRRSTFDVNDTVGKKSESEVKTNEIGSKEFDEKDVDEKTDAKDVSDKMEPLRKHSNIIFSIGSSSDSEEDCSKHDTVIDLTESVSEGSGHSPTKKPRRSTFSKNPVPKKKSSFEVSFTAEKNQCNILDHLNITDSRKSSYKKQSSSGLKRSTESNSKDGTPGSKFVTLRRRREWHTMIDLDTGYSPRKSNCGSGQGGLKKFNDMESGDKIDLSDKSSPDVIADPSCATTNPLKGPTSKKSILKKSMETARKGVRRDTFEIAECFYDTYDGVESLTRPVETRTEPAQDIFDFVSRTPTAKLDNLMIGSGESLIMSQSFLNDSNVSVVPRLTRASTFTKEKEEKETPPPSRKSTRKRWSQVERTPIFDRVPNDYSSIVPDQTTDTTLENTMNKSKSVTIKTPPDFSPKNYSLRTTPSKAKTAEKGKKSVKIETPVKTPRVRLHSPLVMRKTPGPNFNLGDDTILSGNCAGELAPVKTSTPYSKKKEVSLLQKVLTSEKNKSEKNASLRSIGKNSVRSKMPNFAKIHQRQYEKMENLKEMQDRKALRAQFLLSGSKPPVNTSVPKIIVEKESRKQLMFSPKKQETNNISKNNSNTSRVVKPNTSKHLSKPLQHMLNKRTSLDKKKKEIKSRVPVAIARPVVIATAKPEPKGFTRFGFKLPTGKENVTKDEQIKAVTAKSKIAVNRTETNRKQLVGVRSNRRFELLMKMRESKNRLAASAPSGFKYQPKKPLMKVGSSYKQPISRPAGNVITTSTGTGSKKATSKPLQHMLNKKTLKEKTKNQGKSKIPVRSKNVSGKIKGLNDGKCFTRFGFKLPLGKENVTKAHQIKAVSLKSRIVKDRTEENRYQLREVRGNRRFELLMKIRRGNM